MAVGKGSIGISGPPEIDPVIVKLKGRDLVGAKNERSLPYLMVCNEKHA